MPPPSAPGAVTKYLHGVEGLEVVGPQEAPVRFRLGPGIAAEPQRGLVPQNRVADQRRLEKPVPYTYDSRSVR